MGSTDLGWGLLSQFSQFRYFPHFPLLPKQTLAIEYHVYIWQVSPQLSCGDSCQIWMWFRESNRYFCKIENFAYGEINERSFSNPHPWSGAWPIIIIHHCCMSILSRPPTWWSHDMETLSALLALYWGNPPVTGGFTPHKGQAMRSIYWVFFVFVVTLFISDAYRRQIDKEYFEYIYILIRNQCIFRVYIFFSDTNVHLGYTYSSPKPMYIQGTYILLRNQRVFILYIFFSETKKYFVISFSRYPCIVSRLIYWHK